MLVKVALTLDNIIEREIAASSIKEILNQLKFSDGKEFTDTIIKDNYKYVLLDSSEELEPVGLIDQVIFTEITGYDTLWIVPDIEGEGVAIVAAIAGVSAAAVAASTALTIAALVINIAISIVISLVISLLSPTPEFSSDPSQAQLKQSSLFNGAPLLREQGGSVPIAMGNPFCGGVLISSGVSTEDIITTQG